MTSSSRFNELFFPLGVIGDKVAPVSNPSHEMIVREGILLLAVSKPGLSYVLMARRANQVVRILQLWLLTTNSFQQEMVLN